MEFSVIQGRFREFKWNGSPRWRIFGKKSKKVIAFTDRSRYFPFFAFTGIPRKSTLTSASLLAVILPRKNAKDLKDGADFQKDYRYNVYLCSSVVLADVLEHCYEFDV